MATSRRRGASRARDIEARIRSLDEPGRPRGVAKTDGSGRIARLGKSAHKDVDLDAVRTLRDKLLKELERSARVTAELVQTTHDLEDLVHRVERTIMRVEGSVGEAGRESGKLAPGTGGEPS